MSSEHAHEILGWLIAMNAAQMVWLLIVMLLSMHRHFNGDRRS